MSKFISYPSLYHIQVYIMPSLYHIQVYIMPSFYHVQVYIISKFISCPSLYHVQVYIMSKYVYCISIYHVQVCINIYHVLFQKDHGRKRDFFPSMSTMQVKSIQSPAKGLLQKSSKPKWKNARFTWKESIKNSLKLNIGAYARTHLLHKAITLFFRSFVGKIILNSLVDDLSLFLYTISNKHFFQKRILLIIIIDY